MSISNSFRVQTRGGNQRVGDYSSSGRDEKDDHYELDQGGYEGASVRQAGEIYSLRKQLAERSDTVGLTRQEEMYVNQMQNEIESYKDIIREKEEEERRRIYEISQLRKEKTKTLIKEVMVPVPTKSKFIETQFIEMWDKLKTQDDECPICLEKLTKETLYLSICGHMICQTCRIELDKCPHCRTPLGE